MTRASCRPSTPAVSCAVLKDGSRRLLSSENRRQEKQWERRALVELRSGDVRRFLDAYWEHERIHDFATLEEVRRHLVAHWFAATRATPDTVMLAVRRSDVDELNRLAREVLAEDGLLGAQVIEVDGCPFATGDRVILLQNRRALGLLNGMRGTVRAVDAETGSMRVTLTTDEEVLVPHRYIEAGHVAHGYAITIHKAQGLTVDQAFVLGGDDLHREAGYTALSRARTSTHLYMTTATLYEGRPELSHAPTPVRRRSKILERWLRISRAEHLGIDRATELGR